MTGHINVPEDVARLFVDAWAWTLVDPKTYPHALGPVAEHNRRMLAVCRAELARIAKEAE